MSEDSNVLKQRKEKAETLENSGVDLFPNKIKKENSVREVIDYIDKNYNPVSPEDKIFSVCGRIMSLRRMGKAAFLNIEDMTGKIQGHVTRDGVGVEKYEIFKKFDIGDIIQINGKPFKTHTGENTISATDIRLVTKSLYPLPEKYHGLKDVETRYRQRYLDIIMDSEVREVFKLRSKIIGIIREYFTQNNFLEVETPMMQTIVGGATAKPFVTHHNALDMSLFLRIAPELPLKRLLVGGFERVFELNRNFRNEGISTQHNPEFTMLEFYEAYAVFEDLMDRTEELFKDIAMKIHGKYELPYGEATIDFAKWQRISFHDSIAICLFNNKKIDELSEEESDEIFNKEKIDERLKHYGVKMHADEPLGKYQAKLFDLFVEPQLIQPTFVTHYPTDISPLARKNAENPLITDRFELFIGGKEIANGFSELNDPRDQKMRFEEQVAMKELDEEIPPEVDYDYIRALEYAMPPAAGEGIGIDRLVMLFTNSLSIRDVILFPLMKPHQTVSDEKKAVIKAS